MTLKNRNFISVFHRIRDGIELRPLLFATLTVCFALFLEIKLRSLAIVFPFFGALLIFLFYEVRRQIKLTILITAAILLFNSIIIADRFGRMPDADYDDVTFAGTVKYVELCVNQTARITLDSKEYGRLLWKTDVDTACLYSIFDSVEVDGNIRIPGRGRNPGEFDYRNYLHEKGIGAEIVVSEINKKDSPLFGGIIVKINILLFTIKKEIASNLGQYSNIGSALFMGDKSLLENEDREMFSQMNCSHLLAVSGTHFSGFLAVFPYLFGNRKAKTVKDVVLYFLFCSFICVFTGFGNSVIRAAFTSFFAYVSKEKLSGLSFASLCIVLLNPFAVASIGFLMTFSCSISIHMFSRVLEDKIMEWIHMKKPASLLAFTIASQIGMIPFWLTGNIRVSLITFPVQIIESLIVQIGCILFLSVSLFGMVIHPSLFSLLDGVLILVVRILEYSESLGIKTYNLKYFGTGMMVVILCVVVSHLIQKSLIRTVLNFMAVLMVLVLGFYAVLGSFRNDDFLVVFIDVGQGDSCLIHTSKYNVLIDGGIYSEGVTSVASVLDYYGIEKVDLAIMTHWDEDHAGGIAALYNLGRVKKMATSYVGINENSEIFIRNDFPDVCDLNAFLNSEFIQLKAGDRISLSDNVSLDCISPSRPTNGDNEDSVVLLLDSPSFKCLFTGDIGFETEEKLISDNLLSDIDVLKIGHHGSRYSTSVCFVEKLMPEYAVFSVGKYNYYGHPSSEAISSVESVNSQVMMTSDCGAILINVDENKYEIFAYL